MSGLEQQIKKWYWFNLVILSILLELICEYEKESYWVYIIWLRWKTWESMLIQINLNCNHEQDLLAHKSMFVEKMYGSVFVTFSNLNCA